MMTEFDRLVDKKYVQARRNNCAKCKKYESERETSLCAYNKAHLWGVWKFLETLVESEEESDDPELDLFYYPETIKLLKELVVQLDEAVKEHE